ncbi:hypothetical protein OIO90_002979 [Microbotryomycetes sp. JL221]|nr:hypothetical protein OIO90_002979 [Microbotryomycetes sp. JL221]
MAPISSASVHGLSSWFCRLLLVTGLHLPACNAIVERNQNPATVRTTLGVVHGATDSSVRRFTVPYALPPVGSRRFKDPQPIASLNKLVLIPNSVSQALRHHGGSFLLGSSSASGLDGSALASAHDILVVTVQTRLGVLGYLRNSRLDIQGNFGLKDMVAALTFVQRHISAFGGDSSRVTLAGQSSGAEMVKTLLVTPAASSLFHRAILHSPPLDLTDQTATQASAIGQLIADQLECSTPSCLRSRSISKLLAVQESIVALGQSGQLQGLRMTDSFLRPVVDGRLVTRDFVDVTKHRQALIDSGKRLILTTMKDDAALGTFALFPQPQPPAAFAPAVQAIYGPRASDIIRSGIYTPAAAPDAARESMTRVGTDFTWRCPVHQTALNLTAAGHADIYVARFDRGISYLSGAVAFTASKATHEDDILAVFGPLDPSSLSSAQQNLVQEVQSRWAAFVKTGSPNTAQHSDWTAVKSGGPSGSGGILNVLRLGGGTNEESVFVDELNDAACAIGTGVYRPF